MKTEMRKKIRNLIGIFGLAVIGILTVGTKAYAGTINGEESRVIGVASGTFYYNNEAYRAKPEYISQLSGKLASDGVDLTASQANEAIRQIYASVSEGVSGGYLYKVNTESSSEDEDNTDKGEDTTTEESTSGETNTEDTGDNTEENREETKADTPKETVKLDAKGVDEKRTELEKTVNAVEQVSAEHSIGKITYSNEEHSFVYEKGDGSKEVVLQSDNIKKVMDSYAHHAGIILFIMLALEVAVGVVLFLGKCFPWQKKSRNRSTAKYYVNHRRRRRLRSIAGVIYCVCISIMISAAVFMSGIYVTLINKDFICDNMTSSGYYRYVYEDFRVTTQLDLVAYSKESIDRMLDVIGYDGFLNISKKQLEKELAGENYDNDVSELQKKLEASAKGFSKEEKTEAVNVILGNLQAYTSDMIGRTVYEFHSGFNGLLIKIIPVYVVTLLIALAVVTAMDRYRYRGVRYISTAIIWGSLLAGAEMVFVFINKMYSRFMLEPESLSLFFTEYFKNSIAIVIAIGCVGIMLGLSLGLLAKVMRRIQIEKES